MRIDVEHLSLFGFDDFIQSEFAADVRHEYIGGQVYAMTSASDRHGLITLNIATCLRPRVRGTDCQLFANDMKVRLNLSHQDIFNYPDLLLFCNPTDRETYYRTLQLQACWMRRSKSANDFQLRT